MDYRDAGGNVNKEELRRQLRQEDERLRQLREFRDHDQEHVRVDDKEIENEEKHRRELQAKLRAAESRRK